MTERTTCRLSVKRKFLATWTGAERGELRGESRQRPPDAGLIGLQTEGTPIEFRNWTLTPLPPGKDTSAPAPPVGK